MTPARIVLRVTKTRITADPPGQACPAISGDRILWHGSPVRVYDPASALKCLIWSKKPAASG